MPGFLKVFFALVLVLSTAACGSPPDGMHGGVKTYFDQTSGKTNQSWSSERNATAFGIGFFWNIVPGLHLAGVWIDTFFLWSSLETTAMGHGAIIARRLNCNHLVVPEDYVIIQSKWTGELDTSKIIMILNSIDEFQEGYKQGAQIGQSLANRSMKATTVIRNVIANKIQEKITGKILGKYATKILVKKVAGFVPFVGALLAGAMNTWMFVGPLESAAQEYFQTKARYVCR
jgi:hypothetical protein